MRGGRVAGRRGAVAAVAVVLCLTACEQVAVQAYDPPRKFGSRENVSTYVTAGGGHARATLSDRMLYATADGELVAIDVTTGRTEWKAESRFDGGSVADSNAPARVHAAGRWQVIASFNGDVAGSGTTKDHRECEVLSVDAHNGKKVWQTSLRLPAADEGRDQPVCEFVGADDRVAVVVYGERTYAVDVRTHKVRWYRDNFSARVLEGGVVTGLTQPAGYTTAYRLIGVDAVGNEVAWRRSTNLLDPGVSSAGPGLIALVATDYDSADAMFLLMRASGRQLDRTGYAAAYGASARPCAYDQRSVTVCTANAGSDPVAFAYDVKSGKRLWTLRTTESRRVPRVRSAFHGVAYGELQNSDGEAESRLLLDARTGKDEKGDPGAAPVLVSRFGGLVADESSTTTVYRATG